MGSVTHLARLGISPRFRIWLIARASSVIKIARFV